MNVHDVAHQITDVDCAGGTRLRLTWSQGLTVTLEMDGLIAPRLLSDPALLSQVAIGDWGHSLVWPDDVEIGADTLWRETLTATGRDDTRRFLEWRLRHGLSLSKAAEALGLSRRMVAYYSNGERKIPRPVLLACRGWEVETAQAA